MAFEVARIKEKERLRMTVKDLEDSVRCQGCKIYPICGGWGEFDDSRWCTQECEWCRAICCRSPKAKESIKQLNGLGIQNVKWVPFEVDLPPIIPQLNAHSFGVYHPAYGISAKKLFYPTTGGWSKEKNLRKRFGIPSESKIVLSFSVKDVILDTWAHFLDEACERLAEYDIDYVTAMNFSIYRNYPPLDRLVSLRRRFYTMERLQNHGIKVIPSIGWVREIDLKRQARWCRENKPSMVSYNMTMIRARPGNSDWEPEMDQLRKFREWCGYPVKFLMTGASGPSRIKGLVTDLDGVIFYDTKTYRFAEFHRKVWDLDWDKSVSVKDMFSQNLEYSSWVYDLTLEDKEDQRREANG